MSFIITLLACLNPILNYSSLRQLTCIAEGMLAMSGRVTMLGISRYTNKGGSYRTIQRFFNEKLNWPRIRWLLIKSDLLDKNDITLIAGDEVIATKSGKKTYGLGRFFSSKSGKAVPSVRFLNLSLIRVKNRRSSPLIMEQMIPNIVNSTSNQTDDCDQKDKKTKRGRPLGSQNKNRKDVDKSSYLQFIQTHLKKLLDIVDGKLNLSYFLYDGAFGNNDSMQTVRQCGLHLISKMRHDSALYLPYTGKYSGRGRHRKYGKKIDCRRLHKRYLKETLYEKDVHTCIYQLKVWHKLFADRLNVVILVRKNEKTGKVSHVILFSSDLDLIHDKLIEYYQLRFQIEFNFREAKQFWGLEDFMNIKKTQVHNAANLSMFMVNLSQALLRKKSSKLGQSINDLKSMFRASKYVETTLKLLGKNPDPIFIENLTIQASQMGRVNPLFFPPSSTQIGF